MTPNLWTLPETVHFADTDWRVHTDFRDVLEILRWLDGSADPALTDSERWYVALALFYRDFSLMPPVQYREACEAMATFVQAGRPDGGPCAPRLMDLAAGCGAHRGGHGAGGRARPACAAPPALVELFGLVRQHR